MNLPGRFSLPHRSYGVVLGAAFVAVAFQLVAPDDNWARAVEVALHNVVLIAALDAAGVSERTLWKVTAVIGTLLVISIIYLAGASEEEPIAPRLTGLGTIVVAPFVIAASALSHTRRQGQFTIQTVYAGLALYLMVSLSFAFAFASVQEIGGDPFFSNGVEGTSHDFIYFSLASLTTTGYGDLTAAGELGRTLGVTEALFGQLYLVTVVALIVSNLAPRGANRAQ